MNWKTITALLIVLIAAYFFFARREYPEATSTESMQLIKALYTACSSRNADRLASVDKQLATIRSEGKLQDREFDAFKSIIAQAEQGDWKKAADACYQFAQDQVR